jgi:subtilisin family serine protease
VNPNESTDANGVDDDNNGYKDDINGYNFAEDKARPSAKYGADHGTHIAGTIAAVNNNGEGISSIASGTGNGDGVRIISCQIFDSEGGKASKATVAKAFHYAADNGACIAQCSYGESNRNFASAAEYNAEFSVESDALAYFLDPENCNCEALETNIAVFASGNYNKPASLFPGALDGVISVTAFGPDFLPGGYSNYGAGCDISAPGGDIVEGNPNAPCMILSTGYNSNGGLSYVYKYGTSMACPHVSGVVALGTSYALKLGKKFSKEEFISRLLTSTNNIDAYLKKGSMKLMVEGNQYVSVDVFGKKGKMGTGAVDAWQFLMALEGTPTYLTSPGKTLTINVAECIGETAATCGYTLDVSKETQDALGLNTWGIGTGNGNIELHCTKVGAGKIRFKSSIGGWEEISGLDFYKEISIVSRPSVADNGGWL